MRPGKKRTLSKPTFLVLNYMKWVCQTPSEWFIDSFERLAVGVIN